MDEDSGHICMNVAKGEPLYLWDMNVMPTKKLTFKIRMNGSRSRLLSHHHPIRFNIDTSYLFQVPGMQKSNRMV